MNPNLGVVAFAGKVFFWAGVLMFCIGLGIMVSPVRLMRLAETMNRWISTDALFRRLDSPTWSERVFYRHHRSFGALLVTGAGYVIYQFAWGIDYARLFGHIKVMGSYTAANWLAHSLGFASVLFGIVACCIGIVVFIRPSLLKRLEQRANTWFTVDQSLRHLDRQVTAPDRFFARNPRLVGVLVALGSLYVIISLRLFL